MARAVESADEKMERVKAETAEVLANAVSEITSRALKPELDPFVQGARESAEKLARVANSLEVVESRVQRKLGELDAKIELVQAASSHQELELLASHVKELLASVKHTHEAAREGVKEAARASGEGARARRLAAAAAILAALALAASVAGIWLELHLTR
jgi:hypothetical protein